MFFDLLLNGHYYLPYHKKTDVSVNEFGRPHHVKAGFLDTKD
jgi:hypothetical protein